VIERLLLAIDDSPDSLAATRLAVDLASHLRARLRIVHVSADHVLDAALVAATGRPDGHTARHASAAAILKRAASMATAAGVDVDTELLAGDVGRTVLQDARSWAADLVIVGKSSRSVSGEAYVGAQTRHVLEFAGQPVLVVPPTHRH
jgi:nucleotide-binding universal stress UspA family protein